VKAWLGPLEEGRGSGGGLGVSRETRKAAVESKRQQQQQKGKPSVRGK
jgi:hypothetical protein